MQERGISKSDCYNTVRGGTCTMVEFTDGTYRYQISTHRFGVAVAFDSDDEMVFVTCWK